MSLRTIRFGPIAFSSTLDKLSLHAEYEVVVRLPCGKLESLSVDECLKALTSGEIWVSSGNSCRIDLSITVDGRELVKSNDNHIVESLGKFVAGSKIWGQLGLSTILHLQNASLQKESLSIRLNHNEPSTLSVVNSRPWSYTTTDVKAPEALPCVQMERLRLCLAFRSPPVVKRISKRVKPSALDPGIDKNSPVRFKINNSGAPTKSLVIKLGPSERISLLLKSFDSIKQSQITQSTVPTTASSIIKLPGQKISGILEEYSKILCSSLTLHAIPALSQLSTYISSLPFSYKPSTSRRTISLNKYGKRIDYPIKNLQKLAVRALENKVDNSVPSKETGMDEIMLLSGDDKDSSLTVEKPTRKRRALACSQENNAYVLDPTVSFKLVGAAIRAMIAGTEMRRRATNGVKIDNISNIPATSLATLSPVMFSPGFKKSMAHNSRYAPRIIQMLTSLAHNAQTLSLKQKLVDIANIPSSEFASGITDGEIDGELDSEKRLAAVVQARLWSMMQRTLYDPSAAHQATNKRMTSDNAPLMEEDDGYDDLLNSIGTDVDIEDLKKGDDDFQWIIDEHHSEKSAFDCILIDSEEISGDAFDDILGDGDDLLLSDEERERLETEFETEEMFFGRRWQLEDEELLYDDLLFVEDSAHDDLLLEEENGILGERLLFNRDEMLLI
ncbi:283ba3af-b687-46e8-8293-9ca139fd5b87 [Sclerotinia trifoliorum]|uniref:283ba3af-b687-46e8-8293-9ca139fd5b87 n=1 Tax=Sclerotinia trifoliorum TaxID=28548 RepID=A0A8H2W311_9HELO|nr:283ba3af-b687-46e8-8293-9ca139fd5b87 [Sclerotinia trifoliorum]